MSGRRSKQIRREVRAAVNVDVRAWWAGIVALPVRKRLRLAWMLARGKKGGAG